MTTMEQAPRLNYLEYPPHPGEVTYQQTIDSLHKIIDMNSLAIEPLKSLTPYNVMSNPHFYSEGAVKHSTPLVERSDSSDTVRAFEKLDLEQHSGSFKDRGAWLAGYEAITANPSIRYLVAYSAGNHGGGVAHFAEWYNAQPTQTAKGPWRMKNPSEHVQVHIFCKNEVSEAKKELLQKRATVHDYKRHKTLEDAADSAVTFVKDCGVDKLGRPQAVLIPPYEDPNVRAGQSTELLDVLMQFWQQDIDTINRPLDFYVAVGGGGLLLGCAALLSELKTLGLVHSDSQIIGVQQENCDAFIRGLSYLDAGQDVPADLFPMAEGQPGFDPDVDGTAVYRPALSHLQMAQFLRDRGHLRLASVTKQLVGREMQMARELGVDKEPAGALARACQRQEYQRIMCDTERLQVAVASGGNLSPATREVFNAAAEDAVSFIGSAALLSGATVAHRAGLVVPRSR